MVKVLAMIVQILSTVLKSKTENMFSLILIWGIMIRGCFEFFFDIPYNYIILSDCKILLILYDRFS